MKEIIGFLKQRQNVKYSLWFITIGLAFIFIFLADRAQISQIPREPIKIDLGTKEARGHLLSGWSTDQKWGETTIVRATEKESSFIISLPEKETHRLTIKVFSITPLDIPNQKIKICFNDVALDQFEFKKTPRWQKFRITIPHHLILKENTLKLSYSEDIPLSPVVFDYLKFKDYVARLHKGITLYLLYDPPTPRQPTPRQPTPRKPTLRKPEELPLFLRLFFEPTSRPLSEEVSLQPPVSRPPSKEVSFQPKFKAFGFSLAFIISLWIVWLLSPRFLYLRTKLELSRLLRLDLLTYLPGLVLLLLLALISFFSKYYIVYSLKTFFILSVVPTAMAKAWLIYSKSKFLTGVNRSIESLVKFMGLISKKIFLDIAVKKIPSFLNLACQKIKISRRLLIKYHRKDRSSAFIVDFMLLILLCLLLLFCQPFLVLTIGDRVTTKIIEWPAVLAYCFLVIGVVMKLVAFFREK